MLLERLLLVGVLWHNFPPPLVVAPLVVVPPPPPLAMPPPLLLAAVLVQLQATAWCIAVVLLGPAQRSWS